MNGDEEGAGTRSAGSKTETEAEKQNRDEQLRLLAIEKLKCDHLMSGEFCCLSSQSVSDRMSFGRDILPIVV